MISIHPLTEENWNAFEALFGPRGACAGCWCMYWKLPRKEYSAGQGDANRLAQKRIVDAGHIPGLLAFVDGEPAGWIAVEPRQNFPVLNNSRILKAIDNQAVWSIPCFFVSKKYRRQRLTVAMLKSAIEYVSNQGGKILEGYPVDIKPDEKAPPVFIYTGVASAFIQAGFIEVVRRSEKRPIMRYHIENK